MDRIVVGIDSSPAAQAALRWSYAEAAASGRDLLAVHVVDWSRRAGTRGGPQARNSRHEASLLTQERVLAALPALHDMHPDVRVTISLQSGRLAAALASLSRGEAMIVVGEPQSPERLRLPDDLAATCACEVAVVDASARVRRVTGTGGTVSRHPAGTPGTAPDER